MTELISKPVYSKREGGKGDRRIKGIEKEKRGRKCEIDKGKHKERMQDIGGLRQDTFHFLEEREIEPSNDD
jgi:hypothetical protein